jgi:hypothetical protein
MGTSTTLLNHFAVGVLHDIENLLASFAVSADSPTVTVTAFPDFCTVSENVRMIEKSLTGTMLYVRVPMEIRNGHIHFLSMLLQLSTQEPQS